MRRTLSLSLSLLFLTSLAAAQPQPPPAGSSTVRIFDRFTVTIPAGWRVGPRTATSHEFFIPLSKELGLPPASDKNPKPSIVIGADIGMLVTLETRRDHAEALRRLSEIAAEYPEPSKTLVIDGWPAIERRYRYLMPQPGQEETRGSTTVTWFTTTAVAVSSLVVRF